MLIYYTRIKREKGSAWLVISMAPWFLFKAILKSIWGIPILASGKAWSLGKMYPLETMINFYVNVPWLQQSFVQTAQTLFAALFVVFMAGCGILVVCRLRKPSLPILLLMFQVGLVLFAPPDFFSGVSDMSRILIAVFPYLVLSYAEQKTALGKYLLRFGISFTIPATVFYVLLKAFEYRLIT